MKQYRTFFTIEVIIDATDSEAATETMYRWVESISPVMENIVHWEDTHWDDPDIFEDQDISLHI